MGEILKNSSRLFFTKYIYFFPLILTINFNENFVGGNWKALGRVGDFGWGRGAVQCPLILYLAEFFYCFISFLFFFGLFGWQVAFPYPPMTPITTFPSPPAPCFLSVCKEKDMFVAIRNRGEESGNIIQNRETSSFITLSLNEKEKGILGSGRKEAFETLATSGVSNYSMSPFIC